MLAERIGAPVILDGEIVALTDGRPDFSLRQPSWRGLRIDKEPADVHRED